MSPLTGPAHLPIGLSAYHHLAQFADCLSKKSHSPKIQLGLSCPRIIPASYVFLLSLQNLPVYWNHYLVCTLSLSSPSLSFHYFGHCLGSDPHLLSPGLFNNLSNITSFFSSLYTRITLLNCYCKQKLSGIRKKKDTERRFLMSLKGRPQSTSRPSAFLCRMTLLNPSPATQGCLPYSEHHCPPFPHLQCLLSACWNSCPQCVSSSDQLHSPMHTQTIILLQHCLPSWLVVYAWDQGQCPLHFLLSPTWWFTQIRCLSTEWNRVLPTKWIITEVL